MNHIDENLIRCAQEGDKDAFEQMYKEVSPFVYTIIVRITGNKPDAQDVMQNVFIKIFKQLGSFQFRSSFKTWLYRIAVNEALNRVKKTAREMQRLVDVDPTVASVDPSARPDETMMNKHDALLLNTLLDHLNPDQRACIVLREIDGMNYRDISESLDINVNTVRTRLKRAREMLMKLGQSEVKAYGLP